MKDDDTWTQQICITSVLYWVSTCMSTFHVRYVDKTAMPDMHLVGNGIQTRTIHWNDTFLTLLKPQAALQSTWSTLVFFPWQILIEGWDVLTRTHSHQLERGVPRTFQSTIPPPMGKTHFFPHLFLVGEGWGQKTSNLSTNRMTCANTKSFQINTNADNTS